MADDFDKVVRQRDVTMLTCFPGVKRVHSPGSLQSRFCRSLPSPTETGHSAFGSALVVVE